MRPEILFPLFTPVASLKGVGPKLGKLVEKAAGGRLIDLVFDLPVGLIDRSRSPGLDEAAPGDIVTVTVTIDRHVVPDTARQPYRILCSNATGFIWLVFFRARGDWLAKTLPIGEERVISGRIDEFNGALQMTHPDHIARPGDLDLAIEPVYPLTAGLSPRIIRRAVEAALDRAPDLPEWHDPALLARERWPPWRAALESAHEPGSEVDLEPLAVARRRLAYDELLADQLALALIRARARRPRARAVLGSGALAARLVATLPWPLTGAQQRAQADILHDLAGPHRMSRLLQGDVGSGKTLVALLAMLAVVEGGGQAALMAPTEILARQHLATIARLVAPLGIETALLSGREKGRAREAVLARLAEGAIRILIGTHALFQEGVIFHDLALAVIDEQHRFGVEQRALLAAKGSGIDMLVMTATPIPRSLLLTTYGDLDASRLDEKPPGRRPIRTSLVTIDRIDEVTAGIERVLARGGKAYWVCPVIEEEETVDLAAAEARHAALAERFGARVGLLHGRMRAAERDAAMAAFADGRVDLLVATTVIEVGVDVPAATIMVIEQAERFGLAQLHQLRGRVGRGAAESDCVLLYAPPLGELAAKRLRLMRETEDGFRIAEADLEIRGAGEVLGTRQSGLPAYRLARLPEHQDLLAMAHDEARLIIARDPALAGARGAALRNLLYLFERDAAVRYLHAG